ncbi:MAG: S41 family peptidase, partial [Chloroflexota bacterium]
TIPAETALAVPTPALQANPEISQEEQLQVFEQVVETVTEVYVYPEVVNGETWKQSVSAFRTKIEAGLDTQTFYEEMKSLIEGLGDEHSYFESPVEVALSEAQLAASNEYSGIGVFMLAQVEKGQGSVIAVFPDSPAEHAGLKPHDALLAVDGLPIVEDEEFVGYRLRGPECSAVRVTVRSPGEEPRDILMMRASIEGGLPVDNRLVDTNDGSRVAYIMLPSFFDRTIPRQVERALQSFGDLDGLILDNRMNGGGTSNIVERILGYFTSGNLGSFRSRTESRPFVIEADPIANSQTVPLIILIGENSASFGEIFSGVLKDNGRAMLVGQPTLGNVELLHGYSLPDGSNLWIAEETFDPAVSHANWELSGLLPDLEAFADWDTFTFETDPAIAAALTLLGH